MRSFLRYAALLPLVLLVGCSVSQDRVGSPPRGAPGRSPLTAEGDVATWELLEPADVARLPSGDHTCPGNDAVPVEIELDESLGGRNLVDAACPRAERAGAMGIGWLRPPAGQVPCA